MGEDGNLALGKIKEPRYVVDLARQLRKDQTTAEQLLWACLRDRRIAGAKFRRQHPLGRYIADFYCHEANLVIELEGSIHNKEGQREYDAARQEIMEQRGITVLYFRNDRLIRELEGVLAEIVNALPVSPSPLSRLERGRG